MVEIYEEIRGLLLFLTAATPVFSVIRLGWLTRLVTSKGLEEKPKDSKMFSVFNPVLEPFSSNRIDNIVIIADEAHRSQYKVMVQNIQSSSKCPQNRLYRNTYIVWYCYSTIWQSNMRTITAHDDILRYSRNSKLKITKEWNKGTE